MTYNIDHIEIMQIESRTLTKEEISHAIWNTNLDSFNNRSTGFLLKESNSSLNALLNINLGSWNIFNNKMVFYDIDKNIIVEYNLYDENNKPSMDNVVRREKI